MGLAAQADLLKGYYNTVVAVAARTGTPEKWISMTLLHVPKRALEDLIYTL